MDYEKKYKEALEVAKRKLCFDKAGMVDSFTPNDIYEMFPELKESKDNKMINFIANELMCLRALESNGGGKGSDRYKELTEAIAWLEKQGEQGEIDYDEELKRCKANPIYFFDKYVKIKLKEQNSTWSEEDERIYKVVLELMDSYSKGTIGGCIISPNTDRYIKWLKSIKDRVQVQSQWKPSDEQIEALVSAIDVMIDNRGAGDKNTILLSGLYHELKKLREE